MAWSERTKTALTKWLAPDTWHKIHPADDERFYLFVASVWHDDHGIWDEAATRERIVSAVQRLHPGYDELAKEVAAKRVSEGTTILDFLLNVKDTGNLDLLAR